MGQTTLKHLRNEWEDVRNELQSSIREQIEDSESQLERKLNSSEVEDILKQLGHRAVLHHRHTHYQCSMGVRAQWYG